MQQSTDDGRSYTTHGSLSLGKEKGSLSSLGPYRRIEYPAHFLVPSRTGLTVAFKG